MRADTRVDAVLVVATSARALVCSARRGGYRVRAVDGFGDEDTRRKAEQVIPVTATSDGLDGAEMLSATHRLASRGPVAGLVYGSGLEACTHVLGWIGSSTRILGNSGRTLRDSREPHRLADICAAMGADYAESRDSPPADPEHWLVKVRGGSGGTSVRRAGGLYGQPAAGAFYQRFHDGALVSALFLADGRKARVLGIHEQWCADPDQVGAEFVHGGAVTRSDLLPTLSAAFHQLVNGLTAAVGLRGLNGVDCIADGNGRLVLIELNPRPCASMDLYDADYAEGLFHWHLASLAGVLAPDVAAPRHARGYLVVYAPRECRVPEHHTWPAWTSDRPMALTSIPAGAPLCTVHAQANDPTGVRYLLAQREQQALEALHLTTSRPGAARSKGHRRSMKPAITTY